MRRLITGVMLVAAVTSSGALVACNGDDTVEVAEYEDCDVEDQQSKEAECGYWQHPLGADVAVADHQMNPDWQWIWFPWVVLGRTSRPPAYWMPPRGVKPPMRMVRMPRSKVCSMSLVVDILVAPAPPKPPAPRVNAPVPKINNNVPKAPPMKQPIRLPGQRPAGC